jgi:phosphoribosyl 1,2-cyclic phosphodiesterase
LNTSSSATTTKLEQDQLLLRINGTLPDIKTLGDEEKSERAAEVKQRGINTNTSCSLFAKARETNQIFHLLVDIGQGILKSIEKSISDLRIDTSYLSSILPEAVLITHSHEDHISELPLLADRARDESRNLKVYCTSECRDQIITKFPKINSNNQVSFNVVQPGQTFQLGPFSITPVLADHGENSPAGSVIYIVKLANLKVIIGWDFLSLPNVDENLLWNPDLAILGTQSYNPHPQTGMISVSEAFELVRRWNAKESYIVHYRGLSDFEEATNQWFRGPVKAMTTNELQKIIDSHLQIIGSEGKFKMTVAQEGMVWDSNKSLTQSRQGKENEQLQEDSSGQNAPQFVEIESLQNYIFRIEKERNDDKLKLMIEDRINRFNLEFDKPRTVENAVDNKDVLIAQGVKGMLAKGPDLRIEIIPKPENSEYYIRIRASKGKKNVFSDDILINNRDAQRLKRYIKENFMSSVSAANK